MSRHTGLCRGCSGLGWQGDLHMTLHVEIWQRGLDGLSASYRVFTDAISCESDGPFICVTDKGGARHWYPVTTLAKASSTPSEGSK